MTDRDGRSRLEHTSTVTGTRTRASTVTSMTRTPTTGVGRGIRGGRRALVAVGRTVARVARWLGETVTAVGWLLIGVAIAGLGGGLVLGWAVGWMLAGVAIVLVVTSVPFLLGGHDYRVHLTLAHDHVVAGTEVEGALEVRNAARRSSLPGVVDVPIGDGIVEARVPFLRPDAVHAERLSIRAARRGVIDVGPMSVSRGDPVGLLRREMVWPEVQTIHVHPVTTTIPSTSSGLLHDLEGLPSPDVVDADLAFHAIRDYVPGDSRNHVHWKSTAKTGRLMVRQYEETRQSRIAVLISTAAAGEYASEDEFELAVSAAASLGVQAVRDARELIVSTGAAQPEASRDEVIAVREVPTRSLRMMLDGFSEIEQADRTTRLEDVARLTAQTNGRLSLVFLVSGSEMPLERLRAAATSFGTETGVVIVRCRLGADPRMHRAGELRVITMGALGDLGQLIARGALG